MSAGSITTTTSQDLPEDDTILELTGGENPLEFLTLTGETVFGMIAGMSDPDRIEGWRQAERDLINSDRTAVLEALDRQEEALEAGETPPIYHPIHAGYGSDTDPRRVCDETPHTEGDEVPAEDNMEAHHEAHPEANLEAGEVLVVDREDSTEYVWPARADADEPYLLREIVDGETRQEMAIGEDDAFQRLTMDPEKRRADAVHVDAPLEAAVNGGDRDV